ncbi:mitochondrial pyruvate dehydrogenase protein x component-like protein [Delitschia confertaspora ATCC 74209]|uniref:Mitochondrial pyruvate dehydrogenase protein x component-like protein n=1 Tax=Delitschia confertaspora ATCC 74209 TaxID=1513339 RepID=A0A9P4JPQ0_9PLEO|nr:mitochondrial pyruvate dehydrogenase protein x component-like protein [Delitschia confertaspora ATCC 74209]
MASIASACRLSARVASRQVRNQYGSTRAFHPAPATLAAQNFNMPALSPTMTEGNIATWRVKEGDSFAAGDVLLEIETDKAQMDVEAQDDGILAKIIQGDGSKAVQVGSRIAVMAEPGDDISSLEIAPEERSAPKQEAAKEHQSKQDTPTPANEEKAAISEFKTPPPSTASSKGKAQKQKYPLYPSVQHLLRENGLPKEEADKIPATGPNGRLLKGDVLAYLGRIQASYTAEQQKRIAKLTHLDLSNIKVAAPKTESEEKKLVKAPESQPAVPEPETEVAVPISFKAVQECQKRIQQSLGVFLPVSTFIARATELANEDLPKSRVAKPTADELFNAVLGLDKMKKYTRGQFIPQVTALPPTSLRATKPSTMKKPDIFDLLAGKKAVSPKPSPVSGAAGAAGSINVFSVSVPKGDEKRAQLFLKRMKMALEAEPGRLVV